MAALKLRSIRSGSTLFITTAEAADGDAFVAKMLSAGEAVTEQGVTTWVDEAPVFDAAKATETASAGYTWHKDGNRIRVTRTLVTKLPDGGMTRQLLGFAWRKF